MSPERTPGLRCREIGLLGLALGPGTAGLLSVGSICLQNVLLSSPAVWLGAGLAPLGGGVRPFMQVVQRWTPIGTN
jgi:hypothetical protein